MQIQKRLSWTVIFLLTAVLGGANGLAQGDIPESPRDLRYPELNYQPPQAAKHRSVLANGVVAYLVEDHELPLVTVSLLVRTGDYLDPEGKQGLAGMVGSLLRSGGAGRWSADEFDEEADFLAAAISSSVGETSGQASVNVLSKDLDKALELFFAMLRQPRFQADRLELLKSQTLQRMERRNDRTDGIERREWDRLLRGPEHFSTKPSTQATIESITVEDLVEFHQAYYQPDNFIFAVSGDFDSAVIKEKLSGAMQGWEAKGRSADVPAPQYTPRPGVYMVNKEDVNQGRVSIGHLAVRRGNPDEFALDMMNEILGGSGFTSRITNRVRSDEGLAYSAGSAYNVGTYYEGIFRASFQSKSSSCAEAAQIIVDEINRIRSEKVSPEELETVKTSAIEIFPRYFSSAGAVAGTFANLELIGEDLTYFDTYREKLRAVTVDDVLRVAQTYLDPSKLVILAVGNVEDMLKGNPDRPQFSFTQLAPGGIRRIPLPDPMTMDYPAQN